MLKSLKSSDKSEDVTKKHRGFLEPWHADRNRSPHRSRLGVTFTPSRLFSFLIAHNERPRKRGPVAYRFPQPVNSQALVTAYVHYKSRDLKHRPNQKEY